jgi:DNA polymerase
MNFQKDKRGKELIKLLCIPDHNDEFCFDPGLLKEMYAYCKQDVVAERHAAKLSVALTDDEHLDWCLVEKTNDRGLMVDVDLARAATGYAEIELEEISGKIAKVTGGVITSPRQFVRIKDYLSPYMKADEGIRDAMTVIETDRRAGKEKQRIACDSNVRSKLLDMEKEQPGRLPEKVRSLVELLEEASSSSVHKYRNMVQRAGDHDRVRGAYIYCGASQTGRHSSVGLQVHNLPSKNVLKDLDLDATRKKILSAAPLIDGVMATLKSTLRYSIMAARDHSFVIADWRQIEAVMLPYLANNADADKVLDVFYLQYQNPKFPDIYQVQAAEIFNKAAEEVTNPQRQIGKICVLALGFGGGVKAFQSMARSYDIIISDEDASNILSAWRDSNPWAKRFWNALENAARSAVRHPSEMFQTGRIKYCMPEEGSPLYCELPSGRVLSYPDPKLEIVTGKYGEDRHELTSIKPQWKPKRGETKWGRINLYGGLLAENCTQAAANCLLRHAIRLADEDGWPIVATTHDEIVLEVRDDEIGKAFEGLEAIMLTRPDWAADMPLACELWSKKRYRK